MSGGEPIRCLANDGSSYAANFFGWFFAAIVNTHLCQYLDLGAVLVLGAALQIIAQLLRIWMAPFAPFAITFFITSIGQAFQDTHANSHVASSAKAAHHYLGLIHSMYMLGCLVAPFAASPIASASEPSKWYLFYSVPAGLGVVNLALCAYAFRDTVRIRATTTTNTPTQPTGDQSPETGKKTATQLIKKTLRQSSMWYISVFFFFYLGMCLTASGWVVEYLVDVRNGDLGRVSYVPAGYSGGALLGRLILPGPTHRYGERKMGTLYLVICLAVQLVFWL